jgi:flavin reductase (DIM6/NTAB) family NADH-FMN oxidoreductase RutF
MTEAIATEVVHPDELRGREQYQLMTSLVVPRPIGWISTYATDGTPNVAPFSYFAALAVRPMLVGVSIGHRRHGPKDTLVNIRGNGAFCVNVVTSSLLEAMNETSGDYGPEVDEFDVAGLTKARASFVDAPFVAECPAVLECRRFKEVDLGDTPNTLIIGRVHAVRLDPDLEMVAGTRSVDPESLLPVGRLWGGAYAMPGEVRVLPRPKV